MRLILTLVLLTSSTIVFSGTFDMRKEKLDAYFQSHEIVDGVCIDDRGDICSIDEFLANEFEYDNLSDIVGYAKLWRHMKNLGDIAYHPVREFGRATGLNAKKEINICGVNLIVPIVLYAGCYASITTIPVTCTAGVAISAGTACAATIGTSASLCGASVATITAIAHRCIQQI